MILAARMAKDGQPSELNHVRRVRFAAEAVLWADALIEAVDAERVDEAAMAAENARKVEADAATRRLAADEEMKRLQRIGEVKG